MNDILYIIDNLFINKEVISSNDEYYLYMGLGKPDIKLPKETKYFVNYGILDYDTGNFETGDFSYRLRNKWCFKDRESIKVYIKELNREDFLPAIRSFKLSKLNIE